MPASRALQRASCSARDTENRHLNSLMPERVSMRSTTGGWRMNSSHAVGEQKPITRSTLARLHQERSNSAISPAAGKCAT
jgi:hypothetical protein